MEIIIVAIIIIIVIISIVYASRNRANQEEKTIDIPVDSPVTIVGVYCPKCGSQEFRFLWDKYIVANDKHLEAIPSGFSNQTGHYDGSSSGRSSGLSLGFGRRGNLRLHIGSSGHAHGGTSYSRSENFRYKEVSMKTYRISCKCKLCGDVWQAVVSEDEYPEIKKIPTVD